ncbi:MAG TPA: hypothetical protein VMQ62_04165, partial [Dongiaceae bacterium]|nr:hypothetical protein [Dongiaceae bacterium]
GDARLEIEEAGAIGATDPGGAATAGATERAQGESRGAFGSRAVMAALALVAVASIGFAVMRTRPRETVPPDRSVRRLAIPMTGAAMPDLRGPEPTVSPDGSRIVYCTAGKSGLALRQMDREEAVLLAGTRGAEAASISPDGRRVAIVADGKLRTMALDGGSPVEIADANMSSRPAWIPDGSLVYVAAYNEGLRQVPQTGGSLVTLTTPDAAAGELGHWHPATLPDGHSVLFTIFRKGGAVASQVGVVDLRTHERRVLVEEGCSARWSPSGHLLFARGDTLYAAPFDAATNTLTGAALPVLPGVAVDAFNASGQFDLGADGTLVYFPTTSAIRRLVWREAGGAERSITTEEHPYQYPAISPDGRTLAVTVFEHGAADLWRVDLERGVLSRLTTRPQTEFLPCWSPDGRRLAFVSDDRTFTIYAMPSDGSAPPEMLHQDDVDTIVSDWSPDGRTLAFSKSTGPTRGDLWLLDVSTRQARPFLESPATEGQMHFSPDGRRVAFVSDESGRNEIYVASADGSGGKTRISTAGGTEPRWSRDGRAVFYRSGDDLMSVALASGNDPHAQPPRTILSDPAMLPGWSNYVNYDVAADGRRFAIIEGADPRTTPLQVILNFTEELKRRVPTGAR